MSAQYAIKRISDGWYWRGFDRWTDGPDATVRLFDFVQDAETAGLAECPEPSEAWEVVPWKEPALTPLQQAVQRAQDVSNEQREAHWVYYLPAWKAETFAVSPVSRLLPMQAVIVDRREPEGHPAGESMGKLF